MPYRPVPRPTREEAAADAIVRECEARGHAFPQKAPRVDETSIDPAGRTVDITRTPCPGCGTVRSTTRPVPRPGTTLVAAVGIFERPSPGDVPGVAERAARITDEEPADAAERAGLGRSVPAGFAPDRRGTARPETLTFSVGVPARQFYLLDQHAGVDAIVPVPADAEGAGADGRPTPFPARRCSGRPGAPRRSRSPWSSRRTTPVPSSTATTMSWSWPTGRTPGTSGSRSSVARHGLPPLHAGYGPYRLRHHLRTPADTGEGEACLLQIWPEVYRRPSVLKGRPAG
ncbi:hypothetical protein [Actinomadura xylanilytica]|uniref:hypothetical protein n=1 Tax=Actinomadura xylanilytica TaxID=887459 RepID=UPI00255AC308|nr:hypothetical protein [Actinomadura xylanilytica]MDL4776433.1 hypothetical protein [Actinomadura xylanilytica]